MENFNIIIKTLYGLEEVLAEELKQIGVTEIELLNRAVQFKGNKKHLYQCNLHLRTALSVLQPIAQFTTKNENELYHKAKQINWLQYFNLNQTFAVSGFVSGENFNHSQYVALKVKDAIADSFRDEYDERPNVDVLNPDFQLNVHIADENVTISIDTSGKQLGHRGYRQQNVFAPLAEPLAAGIIMLSGWDKQTEFIDGMCGSGTFGIEAALIATNTPPGMFRSFAFEKLNDFDAELWKLVKTEAQQNIVPTACTIRCSDNSKKAISIATQNAQRAKMAKWIEFEVADFLKLHPKTAKAHIILNPPYGERIQLRNLLQLYRDIGSTLKHQFSGSNAWILSSNIEALKLVGLKPSAKTKLFNGKLECKLHKFELFEGTHKQRVRRMRL